MLKATIESKSFDKMVKTYAEEKLRSYIDEQIEESDDLTNLADKKNENYL